MKICVTVFLLSVSYRIAEYPGDWFENNFHVHCEILCQALVCLLPFNSAFNEVGIAAVPAAGRGSYGSQSPGVMHPNPKPGCEPSEVSALLSAVTFYCPSS